MAVIANNMAARAITDREIEAYFLLMCEAFDLDQNLARPIYFGDPFFSLTHKRVLAEPGSERLVSCLTVVPAQMRHAGGAVLPMAGIAGVATRPEARGRGNASRLLTSTISDLAVDLGYPLAALVSNQPEFYRRFGWECCATAYDWSAAPERMPAYAEGKAVRVLTQPQESDYSNAIHALHERAQSGRIGTLVRDSRRWHCIETFARGRQVGVWECRSGLEAYIAFEARFEEGRRSIQVQEMAAATEAGRRALVGFLARQEGIEIVRGRMNATDFAAFGLDRLTRLQVQLVEGMMLRVTDLEACLAAVAQSGYFTPVLESTPSGLTIRVESEIRPQSNKPVRLFPILDSERVPRLAMSPADEIEGAWISADVGAFTQLYIGYRTATQLHSEGRLRASNTQAVALADHLFPQSDPFLGLPDTF